MLKSPILLIGVEIKRNLTWNFFYVKLEFSIMEPSIIENSNSYFYISSCPSSFFFVAMANQN